MDTQLQKHHANYSDSDNFHATGARLNINLYSQTWHTDLTNSKLRFAFGSRNSSSCLNHTRHSGVSWTIMGYIGPWKCMWNLVYKAVPWKSLLQTHYKQNIKTLHYSRSYNALIHKNCQLPHLHILIHIQHHQAYLYVTMLTETKSVTPISWERISVEFSSH